MDLDRSSTISIQPKRNQREEDGKAIWNDMHGWMEQRQREWDDEMAQLKSEFFSSSSSFKATAAPSSAAAAGVDSRASRRSSDASLQDRMSLGGSSSGGGGGRGLGDVTRGRTFRVTFDVSQFKPEEVTVRTQESSLVVYAKHEEQHEKKSMSREFNRRVDIPSNIDPQSLQCFIRDDGTLLVESSELPSEGYESSSCNRDSPSPMGNSSAHSVFSDRLSDGDTCSPSSRTDREDAYSPSIMDWSSYRVRRQQPDRLSPPSPPPQHGIDRNDLTPQRLDPDQDVCYSWPELNSDDLDVLRRETAQRPSEYAIGTESELRKYTVDDLLNYERRSERVGVHDTAPQNHRPIDSAACTYPSDSIAGRYPRNALDRDPLPGQQRSHLPKENGTAAAATAAGSSSDPDVFSVVIDVGIDFEPHELAVKTVDDKLVVHALRRDPYTGRQICEDLYREFDLPHGVEPETITANLTPDGVLIIEAPRNSWSQTVRSSSHPSGNSYFYDK